MMRTARHLFEQICELPEYYLTRTERAILADNIDVIADDCRQRPYGDGTRGG